MGRKRKAKRGSRKVGRQPRLSITGPVRGHVGPDAAESDIFGSDSSAAESELFGSDSEEEEEPANQAGSSSSSTGLTVLANLTLDYEKAAAKWQEGQQAASRAAHGVGVAACRLETAQQEMRANERKKDVAEVHAEEAASNPREDCAAVFANARTPSFMPLKEGDRVKVADRASLRLRADVQGLPGNIIKIQHSNDPKPFLVRLERGDFHFFGREELVAADSPLMIVGSTVRITKGPPFLVGEIAKIKTDRNLSVSVELPFGVTMEMPKANLEAISAPTASESNPLPGGYHIGDRVRLKEGRHAHWHHQAPWLMDRDEDGAPAMACIVVGTAPAPGHLLVRLKNSMPRHPYLRGMSPGASTQNVLPTDLYTEEAWHRRVVQKCIDAQPVIAEKLKIALSGKTEADRLAQKTQEKVAPLEKAHKKARTALTKGKNAALSSELVTVVKFRDAEKRPSVWRDISAHVNLVWGVRLSGVPQSPPALLDMPDAAVLAKEVDEEDPQGHGEYIVLAQGGGLRNLPQSAYRKRRGVPITLGLKEARSILRRAKPRAKPPEALHSFSLLKAALGAVNKVVLEPAVQNFFDGPDTGIIRCKEIPVPKSLCAVLRPYQRVGFQWLVNNARNGLGCILADDMGLGKTVQTIAMLLYLKEASQLKRPALVVVPTGLLATWQREVSKWAPSLRVHMYHGFHRKMLSCASPSQPDKSDMNKGQDSMPAPATTPMSKRLKGKQAAPQATPDKHSAASSSTPDKQSAASSSTREVAWRCTLPNCPAANAETYRDDPYRAQKKSNHLKSPKHLQLAQELAGTSMPAASSSATPPTASCSAPTGLAADDAAAPSDETVPVRAAPKRWSSCVLCTDQEAPSTPADQQVEQVESVPDAVTPAAQPTEAAPDAASGAEPSADANQPARPRRRRGMCDDEADIFLTSYGTLRSDVEMLLQDQKFSCVILDEAQHIKNYTALISKAVKQMAEATGSMRVAMSGTPVENRLADLHSQFEFILPGYLADSRAEFERNFGKPIAAAVPAGVFSSSSSSSKATGAESLPQGAAQRQSLLQRMIQPFVLRRLKSDPAIAADLPDKVEQNYECEPADDQAALYRAVQEAEFAGIIGAEPGQAPSQFARRGRVLAMIHALREVCNHPSNLKVNRRPPAFPEDKYAARSNIEGSGKCAVFRDILNGIISNGEKAIVFCQYLETIEILDEQIRANFNCEPLKFVGSLDREARDEVAKTFQSDPDRNVMLLSLQAGGVGITLTAATHVIHFDRCYNPAKENQATDRAHRIGQTKTVFVHRLVTKGTFEERLAQIMSQRQQLSDLTVQAGEGWIADLDDGELRDLFSLNGDGSSQVASSSKRRRRGST